MLLVILVVFVFLQSWRATLIPLLTVPVAVIGTFALFPLLGFSINITSMFGLVLAIGIVVDDAIVVVEAVQRHIDDGMSAREATIQAMNEVSAPVVAIAFILAAVFIPVAFIGGISGQIYKQFALTIAVSVLLVRIQRVVAKSGAGIDAAAARINNLAALLARGFGLFNRGFDWTNRKYMSVGWIPDPAVGLRGDRTGRIYIADWRIVPQFAVRLPAERRPGCILRVDSSTRWSIDRADRCRCSQDRRHHQPAAGC